MNQKSLDKKKTDRWSGPVGPSGPIYGNDYDKPKELSNCCNARVHVHSEEEGTNYYVCDECGKPCDLKSWKTKPVEDKLKEKHPTGKTKELDWHIKWDYLLNKKKWKNPDEVNKVLTKFVEDLLTQQRTELLGDVSLIVRGCWVQVQSPTGDFDVIDPKKLNEKLLNLLNKKDE